MGSSASSVPASTEAGGAEKKCNFPNIILAEAGKIPTLGQRQSAMNTHYTALNPENRLDPPSGYQQGVCRADFLRSFVRPILKTHFSPSHAPAVSSNFLA
jgi:hypothetical protein